MMRHVSSVARFSFLVSVTAILVACGTTHQDDRTQGSPSSASAAAEPTAEINPKLPPMTTSAVSSASLSLSENTGALRRICQQQQSNLSMALADYTHSAYIYGVSETIGSSFLQLLNRCTSVGVSVNAAATGYCPYTGFDRPCYADLVRAFGLIQQSGFINGDQVLIGNVLSTAQIGAATPYHP